MGDRLRISGLSVTVGNPPPFRIDQPRGEEFLQALGGAVVAAFTATTPVPPAAVNRDSCIPSTPRDDWFDRIYVIPRSIDAGFVITDQVFAFEVYSSFLELSRTWVAAINNVDSGLSFSGLPILPATILPQSGFTFSVVISPNGPAIIKGTLDFTFDAPAVSVPVDGIRTVLIPVQPEAPVAERLRFGTNVIKKRTELEQRVSYRKIPRQLLDYTFSLEGVDKQILETCLFGKHNRALGVPIWTEPTRLTAAASAGATIITVESTAFADYRVGGLAVIYETAQVFEVLEVLIVTPTTLTFASALGVNHAVNTKVMPVRIATMRPSVSAQKFPVNLETYSVTFRVQDNDSDLADASVFPVFNSKVLLDEANQIEGQMSETFLRDLFVVDGQSGVFDVFTEADRDRRIFSKTFFSTSRQRLFEVRQLLHFLRGRAVSFYVPSFQKEFDVTTDIVSSTDTLTFSNFGYDRFVQGKQPRDVLRLVLKDGTKVIRTVVSSTELSLTEESVTVDAVWGVNALVEEIERVEYILKVRMDSDEVVFNHFDALGQATVTVPVRTVLD